MFDWLLNQIPWQVYAAVGGAFLVGLFIGLRAMGFTARQAWLAVGALGLLIAGATIHQRGRRKGYISARKQQEQADKRAVETRQSVEREVSKLPDPELRERFRRWRIKE